MEKSLDALFGAREPTNLGEFRSFLGFLTCYSKFLPIMATLFRPLYELLAKNSRCKWSEAEKNAFDKSKLVVAMAGVLVRNFEWNAVARYTVLARYCFTKELASKSQMDFVVGRCQKQRSITLNWSRKH